MMSGTMLLSSVATIPNAGLVLQADSYFLFLFRFSSISAMLIDEQSAIKAATIEGGIAVISVKLMQPFWNLATGRSFTYLACNAGFIYIGRQCSDI
jgi:hypothetical protein